MDWRPSTTSRYRPGVTPMKEKVPSAVTTAGAVTAATAEPVSTGVNATRMLVRSVGTGEVPAKAIRPVTFIPGSRARRTPVTSWPSTVTSAVAHSTLLREPAAKGPASAPRPAAPDLAAIVYCPGATAGIEKAPSGPGRAMPSNEDMLDSVAPACPLPSMVNCTPVAGCPSGPTTMPETFAVGTRRTWISMPVRSSPAATLTDVAVAADDAPG